MERQIGEIFNYKGKQYQVVQVTYGCKECAFYTVKCEDLVNFVGECCAIGRTDKTNIMFKEINNMENKQLNIKIPEGMEIDIENTDLPKGIIKFRTTNLTYDEVNSIIRYEYHITHELTGMSSHNIAKLSNLDKLLDIAKYYNKDWIPNWNDIFECKYSNIMINIR